MFSLVSVRWVLGGIWGPFSYQPVLKGRACLRCRGACTRCRATAGSPRPSSQDKPCSSHVRCTHNLVGDISVTAMNCGWGKVMTRAGEAIWAKDLIQQFHFSTFFLWELPAGRWDFFQMNWRLTRWVACPPWVPFSGQTCIPSLLACKGSTSSCHKSTGRENFPCLVLLRGLVQGSPCPAWLGGCCALANEVDEALV